jgi:hypothetical protein
LENSTLVDNIKILETEVIKLRLHEDGFAELLIKNNAVYDTKDILDGKNFCVTNLPGKKIYFLMEIEGEVYTTKEARELAASPQHASHHGAIAICSNMLAHKILGNMYIKINRPQAPTRFFSKRTEAFSWLRSQML